MTRFFAPHSFFVIAKVTNVNLDYKTQLGYYELPSMNILGKAIRYWILWGGYEVLLVDANP